MFQDCKTVGELIGQKILITEFAGFNRKAHTCYIRKTKLW